MSNVCCDFLHKSIERHHTEVKVSPGAHCNGTGFLGRTGVYELMTADEAVRALIHNRAAESELAAAALAGGLRSMRDDGQRLVAEGVTSAEEVLRVTRD